MGTKIVTIFAAFVIIASFLVTLLKAIPVWQHPAWSVGAACFTALPLTRLAFARRSFWPVQVEWRADAIICATLLSIGATLLGLAIGLQDEAPAGKFAHEVFAGWVPTIVFATTVGLIVAVVSLARPEDDNFEARAAILFRGQTGKHVEYVVQKLRSTFEHYAEHVREDLSVTDYDPGEGKYYVGSKNVSRLKSYITDVSTTYKSAFEMEDVATPPPGRPGNRLLYLTVDGRSQIRQGFTGTSVKETIETTIDKSAVCLIESEMHYWVAAVSEPNTWTPARYTQRVEIGLRNCLPDGRILPLRIQRLGEAQWEDHAVHPGQIFMLCTRVDVPPEAGELFDFRLLPLT